jgi:hypothetical protein
MTEALLSLPTDPLETTRTLRTHESGYWVFFVDEDREPYAFFYATKAEAVACAARMTSVSSDARRSCQVLCVEGAEGGHVVRIVGLE